MQSNLERLREHLGKLHTAGKEVLAGDYCLKSKAKHGGPTLEDYETSRDQRKVADCPPNSWPVLLQQWRWASSEYGTLYHYLWLNIRDLTADERALVDDPNQVPIERFTARLNTYLDNLHDGVDYCSPFWVPLPEDWGKRFEDLVGWIRTLDSAMIYAQSAPARDVSKPKDGQLDCPTPPKPAIADEEMAGPYTVEQLAAIFDRDRRTIGRWLNADKLPHRRISDSAIMVAKNCLPK